MKKWIAAVCFLICGSANATLITQNHDLTASGDGSVGYTYFEVTTAGIFDIYTMGPTIDPVLYLFNDDGALDSADLINSNDDSCPVALCGSAGAFNNSLLNEIFLDLGFYVAAIADFGFSQTDAIVGSSINDMTGVAAIVIAAGDTDVNGAIAVSSVSVPEPNTIAIFGLSLLGFASARRLKK